MHRSYRPSPSLAALLAFFALAGCLHDLHDQLKFFPQRGTTLIVDGGVLAAGGWYRRLDGYSNRLPSDVATALALTAKSRE